jgi:hypothetical protein
MPTGDAFDPKSLLPPSLREFIAISEVDRADVFVGDLFQRKFGHPLPEFPHHVVAFYRKACDCVVPFSYVHVLPFGDISLIGGASTDGRAFEAMREDEREEIRAQGGIYLHALRYAFAKFGDRCDAFFGYCGDSRAYEVDVAAGFEPTEHEKLIAVWHKPLDAVRRRCLVAMAHAIGPF